MSNPSVLLVEDDELNRDMLFRRLIRSNFSVDVAVDGIDGVNKAIELKPDVILMDMRMPRMDGLDATRRLKEMELTKHIPIIALSGDIMDSERQKALAAGCNDYDTKPIDLPRLLGKINALL